MLGHGVAAISPKVFTPSALGALDDVLRTLTEETPRLGDGSRILRPDPAVVGLYCDLAHGLTDLMSGRRHRIAVRACLGPQPWEIGLERDGELALISAFMGGPLPDVILFEKAVALETLVKRLIQNLSALESDPSPVPSPLHEAALRLQRQPIAAADARPAYVVPVEATGDHSFVLGAELLVRKSLVASKRSTVRRTDLLPLLFRGRIRISVGEHSVDLSPVHVFLVAEELARLALEAVEASVEGRPYVRRVRVGDADLGIRLGIARDPHGRSRATVSFGSPSQPAERKTVTFPQLSVDAYAQGVLAFGRALARTLTRRDRSQSNNLRVLAFRARLREIADQLRDLSRDDAKINQCPESYRAYALPSGSSASSSVDRGRLRFSPKWYAAVPDVDLRATFLCGEVMLVGATREILAIGRKHGELRWRKQVRPAVSVMTPVGLARFDREGQVRLHDIDSGDVLFDIKLGARSVSATAGAVVSCPGLPRMLILTEGKRHLAAIDLDAGELRWRYAAGRSGAFRVRRAGRLVVLTQGDRSLTALDVTTGEVVWRYCDDLRFSASPTVHRDALFAIAGQGATMGKRTAKLHHVDPWSGECRWSSELPPLASPVGTPLCTADAVVVPTLSRRGTTLVGFDRQTGDIRFEQVVSLGASSCLVVDDAIIVNSDAGELCAIDARDGTVRYRHVFQEEQDGERPRRLEPVLRSGALFVPQSKVHVVRPQDGSVLGRLPTDLVPDLLRVDEQCDVYVVEESGHLAAFAAGPRLSLVR